MSERSTPPNRSRNRNPRDAGAAGRNVLRVGDVPEGAVNLNVEGRRVIGALQGFGQLGSTAQEKIWTHVLTDLGARFGVHERVRLEKDCVDPNLQWHRVGNLWHNAGLGSVLYAMVAQARIVSGLLRRRT